MSGIEIYHNTSFSAVYLWVKYCVYFPGASQGGVVAARPLPPFQRQKKIKLRKEKRENQFAGKCI